MNKYNTTILNISHVQLYRLYDWVFKTGTNSKSNLSTLEERD